MSNIIHLVNNNLIVDFVKYRVLKINNKYKELKDKMFKLEQRKHELELEISSINRLIFLTSQDIEKIEHEIINDSGVK